VAIERLAADKDTDTEDCAGDALEEGALVLPLTDGVCAAL
jgi:hypothetical protein